jgi:hypothetical protein
MSALELALRNLAAWSLQTGALTLTVAMLTRLWPIERPAPRLGLWQTVLAVALGLPLLQPWHAAAGSLDSWALWGSVTPALPGAAPEAPSAWAAWPVAAGGALVLGAVLQATRLGRGLLRLRSLRRDAPSWLPPAWLGTLRDALAPRARFVLAESVRAPATFGLQRPLVVLPAFFAALGRERQQAIAMHELLHARRHDWPAVLVEEILKAALFFHPAVHWLVGRARLAREEWVDAEVVRRLGGRQVYLESLVAVARLAAHTRAVPAASLLRESHLRERVELLLKEGLMSRSRTVVHVVLCTTAAVACITWAASALPLQSATSAPAPAATADKTAAGGPKLLHRVEPLYPPDARNEKVEGVFRIAVSVGTDGVPRQARVVASAATKDRLPKLEAGHPTAGPLEGDPRLAEAALAAVKQWRWAPLLKDGKAVDFDLTVTVAFKLH